MDRLRSMKPNCYMHGQAIKRDDPRMMVSMKDILMTYDLADDPKYKDLLTATSHLNGETINRFTNIHHSVDDLLKKQLMTRELSHLSGTCIQRCMGIDMVNAMSVVSKEADDKNGGKTEFHQRFEAWLKEFPKKDMTGAAAQTDVKGDRMLRPHEQADPDLYMRVIERNAKGVVVRGCKVHTTVGSYCDELLITPCTSTMATLSPRPVRRMDPSSERPMKANKVKIDMIRKLTIIITAIITSLFFATFYPPISWHRANPITGYATTS